MNTKVLFSMVCLTLGAIHTLNVPVYAASSAIPEVNHAELIAEAQKRAREAMQAIVQVSTSLEMHGGELEKPGLLYLNAMIELQNVGDKADRTIAKIVAVAPASLALPFEVIAESKKASAELRAIITQAEQTIIVGSPEKLPEVATRQAYEIACARASMASVAAQLTAINYTDWISTMQQQQQ